LNGFGIGFDGTLWKGSIYLIYEQNSLEVYSTEEVEIEDFTGLKDKNEFDIYEGDIVSFTHNLHYWDFVVSVIEGSNCSSLYFIEIFNNLSENEDKYTFERQKSETGRHKELLYNQSKNMEVIGNINQNPELLNI